METIGYMTTTRLSACQIKVPKVAMVTKSTDNNIKKLKCFLSNEKKLGSTHK
jgi:hypothetical protein